DDPDLARAAAEGVREDGAALRDVGAVVVALLPPPTPAQRAFLQALAARGRLHGVIGLTGDREVDADTHDRWGDLAPPLPDAAAPPHGSAIVQVMDAEEEVREAIRLAAARLAAGTPLHRIAFLYRHADPYALIAAEQLGAAGLPWNGPATMRLTQTLAGRTLL